MDTSSDTRSDDDTGSSILFRVRTITVFVNLRASFFSSDEAVRATSVVRSHIDQCAKVLQTVKLGLENSGYEVQTTRIATNPFGEWLHDGGDSLQMLETANGRLEILASLLAKNGIQFCSLGPADTIDEITLLCPKIVAASPYFSCSAATRDVKSAVAAAQCIRVISKLTGTPSVEVGLGNFRFCATASCKPFIPFFPAAKSSSIGNHDGPVGFALGLENGALARSLLRESASIDNINTVFREGMAAALQPLQEIMESAAKKLGSPYLGIDSSLNPSLDAGGSVAEAMEQLEEIQGNFGGRGTLAAAAAITSSLQSLPGIKLTGYCGLMLPVCEDRRLAELASAEEPSARLGVSDILSISSVCGVGVDTVPIPGDCSDSSLASLILDVAGVASRWDKSLSCRVFPVPGCSGGEMTEFESPYMCNCKVFLL